MIPVVLVASERQRGAVERLVNYAKELDGTSIEVIEFGPETSDRYTGQHLAIRKACTAFKGKSFFWIEPDAIPRKAGWLETICKQRQDRSKPFLLPSLIGRPSVDAASAIGIYPHNAIDIIPEKKPQYPLLAWDHWLYAKKPEMIALTPLIQHSYGIYSKGGLLERRHSFPLDKPILRSYSVIFHSDPGQTLMQFGLPNQKPTTAPLSAHPSVVLPYQ